MVVGLRAIGRDVPVLAAAYLTSAVPFAQIGARRRAAVDLRATGTGTVSGTGLYRVAGAGALVRYGLCEVGKGAFGPALAARVAGRGSPVVVLATGVSVAGHNWSPFLRGRGGRGIAPAMGALLVTAPEASAVLLVGLVLGRVIGETGIGCLLADLALVPVAERVGGGRHGSAAAAAVVPLLAARLAGNAAPRARSAGVYLRRLLLDRDAWAAA